MPVFRCTPDLQVRAINRSVDVNSNSMLHLAAEDQIKRTTSTHTAVPICLQESTKSQFALERHHASTTTKTRVAHGNSHRSYQ